VKQNLRRVLVVMLLGVALYGAFAVYRGLDKMEGVLRTFGWWSFAAACALAFGNYVLRYLKWEFYLARLEIRGIPKFDSFLTFLSGFVLTVTPGKVGEVFKSLVLFETYQVPIARTAPIVVAERVTDLIGIIALIVIGSLGFSGGLMWAGIGAYRLSHEQIVESIQTARRLGVGGIILFSYDSLTDPARGPDYLAQVGRAAFSSQ
jgi:hypothetical protein